MKKFFSSPIGVVGILLVACLGLAILNNVGVNKSSINGGTSTSNTFLVQTTKSSPTKNIVPAPSRSPTPLPYGCAKAPLNIRDGPGVQNSVVGYLNEGECTLIIALNPEKTWANIDRGWVSMKYLSVVGMPILITKYTTVPTPKATITRLPSATRVPTKVQTSTSTTGCPLGCTVHKAGCDIKGNKSIDSGERIYHVPGGEYYNETVIRPEYGERWFCTEAEAIANGWRKSKK